MIPYNFDENKMKKRVEKIVDDIYKKILFRELGNEDSATQEVLMYSIIFMMYITFFEMLIDDGLSKEEALQYLKESYEEAKSEIENYA